MTETFRAFMARETDGKAACEFEDLTEDDLPEDGDAVVSVAYSTLNYKDGLAIKGNQGKVMRNLPMVPGIDLAGVVESPGNSNLKAGDEVVVTGWGLSETSWGGYTQKVRLNSDWLLPLPDGISLQQSMAIGTAGFTAMLSVMALEHMGLETSQGEVLVTGAAGGVAASRSPCSLTSGTKSRPRRAGLKPTTTSNRSVPRASSNGRSSKRMVVPCARLAGRAASTPWAARSW